MKRLKTIVILATLAAGTATAHNGVKNAAVMARMNAMSAIVAEMKTLGTMASGTIGFNAKLARDAAAKISTHAAATSELFKAQENDPKSEAKPSIWENFDDFVTKAATMERVASSLAQSIESRADISAGMVSLGETCKACHAIYRK